MKLVVIAHNIRSCHNIGSIIRSSDGFGVSQLICSGYTPYPKLKNDSRLPHLSQKLSKQISKTALGAEKSLPIKHADDIQTVIKQLKAAGFTIVALEQAKNSQNLANFKTKQPLALVLGEEVNGINSAILNLCDTILEIPMKGQKESFNVSVAAAIALYQLSTFD